MVKSCIFVLYVWVLTYGVVNIIINGAGVITEKVSVKSEFLNSENTSVKGKINNYNKFSYNQKTIDDYYPNFIISNINEQGDIDDFFNIVKAESPNHQRFTIMYLNFMSENGKHFRSMNLDTFGKIVDFEYFYDPTIEFLYTNTQNSVNKLISTTIYYDILGNVKKFYLYATKHNKLI